MTSKRPAWLKGFSRKDWLFDGRPIRSERMIKMWNDLDWSKAWLDMGPSPSGNRGPYWHVPLKSAETVHRLYPKLQTRWARLLRHAIEEAADKSDAPIRAVRQRPS